MSGSPPFRLPARESDAHKGNFGRTLLVGGSRGMCGSIALSAIASLRCGAGLVTAAVPDRCLEVVAAFHPCVMTIPLSDDGSGRFSLDAATGLAGKLAGVAAIGCGPGMTTQPGSVRIVERLLGVPSIPRVFDADAINTLATLDLNETLGDAGPLVLTPHPGELERLTGASASDRDAQVSVAKSFAERTGAVMVVKGGPTVVVSRERVWTNATGNPGMATAGSGDVLTGVITSLLGQRLSAWDAACLGVWVHGRAGDLAAQQHGQFGMTASEILDSLPLAIASAVAK
jgi:ADP-dependent NAD(P)H-hydrate dehydratase